MSSPGSGRAVPVGRHNAKVKLAASLVRRKERERHALVLVEGERLVAQALEFGARFRFLLVDEARIDPALLERLHGSGESLLAVDAAILARAADTVSPQSVVGVAEAVSERAVDLDAAQWVVVADGLQDPGNVGTLMRVATAVGVDGLLLCAGTVDPKHPKAVRGSAGAYFRIPLSTGWAPAELRAALVQRGYRIVAADVRGEVELFDFPWDGRIALVVGSEAHGADPLLAADERVRIPMPGGGESLNAGVAAAIILYQAWHARRKNGIMSSNPLRH